MSTSHTTTNMNISMMSTPASSAPLSTGHTGIRSENRPSLTVPSLPGARLIAISLLMAALATLFLLGTYSLFGASAETILVMTSGLTGVLYMAHAMNATNVSQLVVDVLIGLGMISMALLAPVVPGSLLVAGFLMNSLWAAFYFAQKRETEIAQTLYTSWFSFNMALALIVLLTVQ